MISLRKNANERCVEFGGGARPLLRPECQGGNDVCVDIRMCNDETGTQTVDIVTDLEKPLPMQGDEFDGAFGHYSLEHISWRNIPQFLSEVFRVLKPGGRAVFVIPNTAAQLKWIQENPDGWDGHDAFASCSNVLFGDQDYPENTHKCFFTPEIATSLFTKAGFVNVVTTPHGARHTDMVVECNKPVNLNGSISPEEAKSTLQDIGKSTQEKQIDEVRVKYTREQLFDKHYFHGGGKVGGYVHEGYRDFPVHEITFRHILGRNPKSVLEIGCARGYKVKRLQDVGIPASGLEISKHCILTRACEGIVEWDLCKFPWPVADKAFDLCFSLATLEHIPEEFVDNVISEMIRVSKRQLHGIDFGGHDDGFDKTHCTLRSREWWLSRFNTVWSINKEPHSIEIVDKEVLERGDYRSGLPEEVLRGDGKLKLNLGCFTTMFHYGWENIDQHDLHQFAQVNGYRYGQLDIKKVLPHKTGTVDLIYTSHFLEHLNYKEGLAFLRDCRRVLKKDGCMRIIVPDAQMVTTFYRQGFVKAQPTIDDLSEINDGCEENPHLAGKLWSLLCEGHQACYDIDSLTYALEQSGFIAIPSGFREVSSREGFVQIARETIDMQPEISLFMNAVPKIA